MKDFLGLDLNGLSKGHDEGDYSETVEGGEGQALSKNNCLSDQTNCDCDEIPEVGRDSGNEEDLEVKVKEIENRIGNETTIV